jgi:putative tricarboxylic transport membrane protein
MGALGMLFSTIGRSSVFDMDRLTLGFTGLPESDLRYIPLMIGVFAIAEALTQIEANMKIKKAETSFKNAFPTLQQWKEMIPAITIGSIVGTIVGAIPGTGGDIASYVAYDQTKKFSKHKEKFGKGYAPGVAAPQVANNAVCGGAMIPMLTLGIPGDSVTAVLIGAMIIIGLRPGPTLFTNPDPAMHVMVTSIFVGLMVVAILVTPIRLIGVPLFAKTVTLARQYLWPLVTVFCIVGSFAMTGSMISVYIMFVFGFFGYFMKKFGFPSGPMIIGVILGPLSESNLHRALRISHGAILSMLSPLAIILICLSLFSVLFPLIQRMKKDKESHPSAEGNV